MKKIRKEMEKRMNKKGQDLSIGTLVLIVLGIIVLVLLILGFSIGWGNLLERIGIYQGSSINDVVTACQIAASSGATASFCDDFKEIRVNGQKEYVNCQDDRINNNLGGNSLDCPSPKSVYVGDQLERLCSGEEDNAEFTINGQTLICGAVPTENGEEGSS